MLKMKKENAIYSKKKIVYGRILYVLMLVLFISGISSFFTFAASKSGKCGDNATWVLSDNGMLRVSGTGNIWDAKEVYHPEYQGYEVVQPWNDYKNEIKTVVIDEGITSVGAQAFYCCSNLKYLSLPSTLKSLDCGSFTYTAIEKVDLPDGLEEINSAFDYTPIKEITIPSSVYLFIDAPCNNCDQLSKVIIKKNEPSPDKNFFGEQFWIFSKRALFYNCPLLKEIIVEEGHTNLHTIDGVLYKDTVLVTYPSGKTGSSYTVWDKCTEVYQCAFSSNLNLKSVILPASVESIESGAFHHCENLKELTVKNPNCVFNEIITTYASSSDGEEKSLTIYAADGSTAQAYAENADNKDCLDKLMFKSNEKEHSFGEWKVVKPATCKDLGQKEQVCNNCGWKRVESIPKLTTHTWGTGKILDVATTKSAGNKVYTCSICGITKTETIPKLPSETKLKIDKTSIKLAKTKSITMKVTLLSGDKATVKSSNKNIANAVLSNNNLKITAKKKAGTANITITTTTGKKAVVKVTVPKIKTTKITCKAVSVKKGKTVKLKVSVKPKYSDDKITYKVKNKKIATVSSKGVVKGIKKGKTVITVKSGKKSIKVKVVVK